MLDNKLCDDCEHIRDQIDAYLDNDLELSDQQIFLQHLGHCSDCEQEYQFARQLLRSIHDLPVMDCPEELLEPIAGLSPPGSGPVKPRNSVLDIFSGWINGIMALPAGFKYAVPLASIVVLAVIITPIGQQPTQVAVDEVRIDSTEQYTEQEIRTAIEELNIAMGLLKEFSVLTQTLVEDRFLRQQLEQSVYASFKNKTRNAERDSI